MYKPTKFEFGISILYISHLFLMVWGNDLGRYKHLRENDTLVQLYHTSQLVYSVMTPGMSLTAYS